MGGGFPGANVAVSCGMSDVVVIDVDERHGGDDTILEWQRRYDTDFVRTVTAISGGGGRHYYFRANGKRWGNTQGTIGAGIDTRAVGGLVVAPYSIHESGDRYRWEEGYAPDERAMLAVPDWMEDMLARSSARNIDRKSGSISSRKVREGGVGQEDISSCPTPLEGEITGEYLAAIDADELFVLQAAYFLGMPATTRLTQAFPCILPGHAERHPSASFGRHDNGHYFYKDFHHGSYDSPSVLTIAEVFAARETGRVRKLERVSHATWKLRLLIAMGMLAPAHVPMRPLPAHASASVRRVYEGFRLLLQCRWRYEHGAPTTFSWQFASGWCGVAEETAAKAVKALLAMGIIEAVGSHTGPYGKATMLFLPRPADGPEEGGGR